MDDYGGFVDMLGGLVPPFYFITGDSRNIWGDFCRMVSGLPVMMGWILVADYWSSEQVEKEYEDVKLSCIVVILEQATLLIQQTIY